MHEEDHCSLAGLNSEPYNIRGMAPIKYLVCLALCYCVYSNLSLVRKTVHGSKQTLNTLTDSQLSLSLMIYTATLAMYEAFHQHALMLMATFGLGGAAPGMLG